MLLGAVADDLTGATDLSLMLSREGMRTIQVIGVPEAGLDLADADAVVVALKSRTIPAEEAVEMSLQHRRVPSFEERGTVRHHVVEHAVGGPEEGREPRRDERHLRRGRPRASREHPEARRP